MAMMNFDGSEMQKEFAEVFGKDISELSSRAVWWLVKFAKHVRGRCRSNAALRNYLARNFKGHLFDEVTKQGKFKTYQSLQIRRRGEAEVLEEEADE